MEKHLPQHNPGFIRVVKMNEAGLAKLTPKKKNQEIAKKDEK